MSVYRDDTDELECRRLLDTILLGVLSRIDFTRVVFATMLSPVDHWFGEPMVAITRNLAYISDEGARDLMDVHGGLDPAGMRTIVMVNDIADEIERELKIDDGRLIYRPYQLLRSDGHHYRLRYSKRMVP